MTNEELFHYGVVGMRWGVRRARRKAAANERLTRKALNYDKRAADLTKKSEKAHSKHDLERSNRQATKAAKYDAKAAKLKKKSAGTSSEFERTRLERKSANLEFKATKARMKGNRLSKTTGYGAKAMKYSVKSDTVAMKAAKIRKEIATNDVYIEKMKRKVSSLSPEELRGAYSFVEELKGA